jgi:Putative metallopeptidase
MCERIWTAIRAIGCSLALTCVGSIPGLAQAVPPETEARRYPPDERAQALAAELGVRIIEVAQTLPNKLGLDGLSAQQQRELVESMAGNMVFVLTHELGHAVVSEMELPVLGREEDIADTFAILTALKVVANDFSAGVLKHAAKGWFLSALRNRREGELPSYFERHSLDEQRAYQIVCLMVGFDSVKFADLADETGLPNERRRTCAWDYDASAQSWARVMRPHRRSADQPPTPIEVIYGPGEGELAAYADAFRSMRLLETLADYASRYAWPAPFTMEMRTCGDVGARWTIPTRRLHICYELAQEFLELFRDYGAESIASLWNEQPQEDGAGASPGARGIRGERRAR